MKFQKIRNPVHNLEMNYLNSKEVNHFKNNLKSSIGID
jgi:hypothetical protein